MNVAQEAVSYDAKQRLREIFDTFPASLSGKQRQNEVADLLHMRPRSIKSVWYEEARGRVLVEFLYQYQSWRDRAIARESSKAQREYVEVTQRLRALEQRLADT